ncbi:hypothetical protein GCM10007036_16520 [Alsobacter metallidurans]|uniref:Uncharacterized protein n=1 Tax=Alsobacter metallidurans TaxID=340221 RepID=A0A917I6J9_9HYPH|nr:hypothetical protein [Alsobacter metallidurans]GGH16106.1 hypothetical protein GCM10007036_16520 [Alsobacter metallidurans]
MHAKLADQERAAKAKRKRLRQMSDEQRQAHEQWQKNHRSGSAAVRARRRAEIEQNRAARKTLECAGQSQPSAELQQIAEAIRRAEAEIRRRDNERRIAAGEGIFG